MGKPGGVFAMGGYGLYVWSSFWCYGLVHGGSPCGLAAACGGGRES